MIKDWVEIDKSEYEAMSPYANGNGIDVCCGGRIFPGAVGVDIIPRGNMTEPWKNNSVAQLCFDCGELPFKDNVLDFVVAIHAIEHFLNTMDVLKEWLRVIRPEGHLCLIVPDRRYTPQPGTPGHDITHFREFNPVEFKEIIFELIDTTGKAKMMQYDTLGNEWSFDCVLRKV